MSQKLSGESFLAVLSKSGLIEPQRLQQLLEDYTSAGGDRSDPLMLADALVQRQAITRWQADKLLQGKHKGYFLGKYRLLSLLGRGGMSSVYLAEHVLMRRNCAIKVLPAKRVGDSSYLARFHREAQAVASLDHPNIVRAYDVDHQADRDAEIHFLVMEYVEGVSLQELVAKQGPRGFSEAVDFVRQAAMGLVHAHKAGLVHRDIKPGNLLLDKRGTVKILDLGLARFFSNEGDQEALTIQHDEKVLGTADYLAPEQALDSHTVDARADIYALGCTLYFLLTGHAPFTEGTLAQRLMAHQTKEPPAVDVDRPDMPASLNVLLKKLMAKRPEDRFQSAQDTVDALLGWLTQNADPQWKASHPDLFKGRATDSTKRIAAKVVASITKPAEAPVVSQVGQQAIDSTALLQPTTPLPESPEAPAEAVTAVEEAESQSAPAPSEPELAAFFAGLSTAPANIRETVPSSSIHSGTGSSKLQLSQSPTAAPSPPQSAQPVANSSMPEKQETSAETSERQLPTENVSEPGEPMETPATQPVAPGPDFSFLTAQVSAGEPTITEPGVAWTAPPAIVIDTTLKPAKPVAKPAKVIAPVKAAADVTPPVKAAAKVVAAVIPAPEVIAPFPDDQQPPSDVSDNPQPSEIFCEPSETAVEPAEIEAGLSETIAAPVENSPWGFLEPQSPELSFDLGSPPESLPEFPTEDVTGNIAAEESTEPDVIPANEGAFPIAAGFPGSGIQVSTSVARQRGSASNKAVSKPRSGNSKSQPKPALLIGGGIVAGLVVVGGLVFALGGFGGKAASPSSEVAETPSSDDENPDSSAQDTTAGSNQQVTAKAAPRAASWAQKRETTVGAGGEFATISAALAEIERNFEAQNRSDRFLVKIAAGTYTDRINLAGKGWSQRDWGANVVLRGEGPVVLAPSGSDPVIRLNNVEGVQILNLTVKADGKAVAIELAEMLDRCLLQNLQIDGFTEVGILLSGALGPSFSSDRAQLDSLQFHGSSSAVAIQARKGTQSDSVDCQNILIKKCRMFGPLAAGVRISGLESRAFEIRECVFAETISGVELVDGAAWSDFLLVNNTFYHNDVAVRIAKQPATTSKSFSLRRNLFFESKSADVLVAEGFNETTLFQSQMLGTMFGNWTTRPAEEKPAAGHMVIWAGGQQGQSNIAFVSTTTSDPKFLAPAENAAQKDVGGQAAGEPPWIGAVGP